MKKSKTIGVLGERLQLRQPPEGFRSGTDAVLLAAACPAQSGQSVLDLGCGVGTAGLCVLSRVPEVTLTGVDIQESHIELAKQNAAENGFEAHFHHVDIRHFESQRFDHVICNPPYLESGTHIPSPTTAKATAMGDASLADWLSAAHKHVKSKGSLTLIHRADYTDHIIREMGKRFGGIEIIPLWPRAGQPAKRVIIRCIKDSRAPAMLHPGLVLHEGEGYTEAAEEILRDSEALV